MNGFGILLALIACASAFYLPGVAPRAYQKVWLVVLCPVASVVLSGQDESLALLVNRLDSSESIAPYDYY